MTEAERVETHTSASGPPAHCVLCGNSESRVRFSTTDRLYGTTQKVFDIVECSRCGLLRLSPQPAPGDFEAYYPRSYWFDPDEDQVSRLEEAYRRLVLRDHLQFAARAIRETGARGPLLDVGCGGGLFLAMLRDRHFASIGLDASREAAALAWRRHGLPVVAGDLAAAPFAPASCAVITMFHVLEHVPRPQEYLEEAQRLLKPGGRLIVQVPNAASWQFALLGRAWNGVDAPRHLHLFRDADLERLLNASGFQVLRRKYFSWRDNPTGLATSLARGLDPMARRIRKKPEPAARRLLGDLAYFALVVAAVPLTALEAAFGSGSTVMIEAQRRA